MGRKFTDKLAYYLRNLRAGALFAALEKYCSGDVLDIGGWDFYLTVRKNKKIKFNSWTNLESDPQNLLKIADPRYKAVLGDGSRTGFPDSSFDTVLNIQVLEHVFEPIKMVGEIGRVLKPGGTAIFLIPQTSVLHHAPNHYCNFTKFWIKKAMSTAGLGIVNLKPLGGLWTTTASHLVYFFFKSFRFPGYSTAEDKRNLWFYLLFPFMAVYALVSILVCLLFSLGDLSEEPNNYLVIARKMSERS